MSQKTTNKPTKGDTQDSKQADAKDLKNEELAKSTDEAVKAIDEVLDSKEEIDLIDEIDAVLEENAEEFVKNYVQRGGQ